MSSKMVMRLSTAACAAAFMLTGCATTDGHNETFGALLGAGAGALAGGALGQQIGGRDGRLIGALAGAAAGALIGQQIARNLSERDRQAMDQGTATAFNTAQDGQSTRITLPESGKQLTITPSATSYEPREMEVRRIRQVQAPPQRYEVIEAPYFTTSALNLRATPTTVEDNRLAVLTEGQVVNVAGRIPNSDWMIVSRPDGAVIGYASARFLRAVEAGERVTPSSRTMVAQGGIDLDALDTVSEPVQASTQCRTVTYDLDDMRESGRLCRGQSGVWELA